MIYARALATVLLFAVVHSLPAWAAVLLLVAAVVAFGVLVWWLTCRARVVLSWPAGGIAAARRAARAAAACS